MALPFKQKIIMFLRFIYYLLAVLGLRCCTQGFSSCSKWRLLFSVMPELLTAVASLVAKRGL